MDVKNSSLAIIVMGGKNWNITLKILERRCVTINYVIES